MKPPELLAAEAKDGPAAELRGVTAHMRALTT